MKKRKKMKKQSIWQGFLGGLIATSIFFGVLGIGFSVGTLIKNQQTVETDEVKEEVNEEEKEVETETEEKETEKEEAAQ